MSAVILSFAGAARKVVGGNPSHLSEAVPCASLTRLPGPPQVLDFNMALLAAGKALAAADAANRLYGLGYPQRDFDRAREALVAVFGEDGVVRVRNEMSFRATIS